MYYLGIDLGGINIAAAVTDESGHIVGRDSRPTPHSPAEEVADHMAAAARAAAAIWSATSSAGEWGVGRLSRPTICPDSSVTAAAMLMPPKSIPR